LAARSSTRVVPRSLSLTYVTIDGATLDGGIDRASLIGAG
jgi:hypothetical protein